MFTDMTSSLRQHAILGEAGGMQFKLQYDVREQLQKVSLPLLAFSCLLLM